MKTKRKIEVKERERERERYRPCLAPIMHRRLSAPRAIDFKWSCEESEESDVAATGWCITREIKKDEATETTGGWDTQVRGKEKYGVRGWTEY